MIRNPSASTPRKKQNRSSSPAGSPPTETTTINNNNNSNEQPFDSLKHVKEEEEEILDTTALALKTFLDWEKLPKSQQIIMDTLLNQPNGAFPTAKDCILCFLQIGNRFDVHNDNTKQEAVVFAGSFHLVVSIMRKWPENVRVQHSGSFCLAKVAWAEFPAVATMLTAESGS